MTIVKPEAAAVSPTQDQRPHSATPLHRIALDLEVEILTDADTLIPELIVDNDVTTAGGARDLIAEAARDLDGMRRIVNGYDETPAKDVTADLVARASVLIRATIDADFDEEEFHYSRAVADQLHQAIDRAYAARQADGDDGYTEGAAFRRSAYDTAVAAMGWTLKDADDKGYLALSLKGKLAGAIEAAGLTKHMYGCGQGNPNFDGGFPCTRQFEHDGDHFGDAGGTWPNEAEPVTA